MKIIEYKNISGDELHPLPVLISHNGFRVRLERSNGGVFVVLNDELLDSPFHEDDERIAKLTNLHPLKVARLENSWGNSKEIPFHDNNLFLLFDETRKKSILEIVRFVFEEIYNIND